MTREQRLRNNTTIVFIRLATQELCIDPADGNRRYGHNLKYGKVEALDDAEKKLIQGTIDAFIHVNKSICHSQSSKTIQV
ncbi:hypothetical protein [Phyllobacterium zundukense]|uniref:Uncharacterized protein n=1 Tax=Phyllobacterium zundukense TaxID=1867719 RepID=A0ACD4D5V3_9HYPH|nr:hypothetical protein [Phyllobacterium zundukense]UXN61168.1 hypothetical protein N8E88_13810 [Phyllobacterium zundukense]